MEEEAEDEELDERRRQLARVPDQSLLASLRGSEGAVLRRGSFEEIADYIVQTEEEIEYALERDDVDQAIVLARLSGAATERLRMHPKIERGKEVRLNLIPNFQREGARANARFGQVRRNAVFQLYELACANDPQLRGPGMLSAAARAIEEFIKSRPKNADGPYGTCDACSDASCETCEACRNLWLHENTPIKWPGIYSHLRQLNRSGDLNRI